MLHTETVSPATLDLLKQLMAIPEIDSFVLSGGTSLALQIGHRFPIDIDLVTNESINISKITNAIYDNFHMAVKLDEKQTTSYYINGVRTQLILHQHTYLQPVMEIDGIRLLSMDDIIPMKLHAVSVKGTKHDFWDIAALLNRYSIEEMIGYYRIKYAPDNVASIVRSLLYFDDVELDHDPSWLNMMTWKKVKNKIEIAVKKYVENKMQ